jgi:uncharacterized membrane protein YqjE
MAEPTDVPPGLFVSLKRLWRTLLAVAQNRLELLLVEVEEERRRTVQVLLLVLAVGGLALMAAIAGTFALVVVFWEQRVMVLIVLSGLYLLAAAGAYWKLHRMMTTWAPFSAILAELKKDKACLEEMK